MSVLPYITVRTHGGEGAVRPLPIPADRLLLENTECGLVSKGADQHYKIAARKQPVTNVGIRGMAFVHFGLAKPLMLKFPINFY